MPSLAEKRLVAVADNDEVQSEAAARPEALRLLEALLFASATPLDEATLAKRLPDGIDIKAALLDLQADYAGRGVHLTHVGNKWTFRTASDLSWLMTREVTETRKLSRAAIETLSIIAYHQPVTRTEIEEIRGVATSRGTLDVLLETTWIRPRGRRKTPGRPLTFGTTETFLSQFGIEALGDLPGLEELKGTGLWIPVFPRGSRCRRRRTIPLCVRTKTRSIRAISISASARPWWNPKRANKSVCHSGSREARAR